jgi:hypothetical protein
MVKPMTVANHDRTRVYHCLIKASKQAGAGTRIRFDGGLVAEILDFPTGSIR